ncbi:MAG: hypothetical protein FWF82_04020 [Oscillospiraceae bacterium]|nr:hypothetical protein [Oscillospiraceae bacterium]
MQIKKTVAVLLAAATVMSVAGCSEAETKPAQSEKSESKTTAVTTTVGETTTTFPPPEWIEVPVGIPRTWDTDTFSPSAQFEFDLRNTIIGNAFGITFNTYSFRGTVVGIKEYEVSWTDSDGRFRDSHSRSVLEVKVNEEYHGKSPVEGDIIMVSYPTSMSIVYQDSVDVKVGGEYVFANSRVLDEIYNESTKESDDGVTEHADVQVIGYVRGLFPVDDGQVVLYAGYFSHDEDTMKKAIPMDSVNCSMLLGGSDLLEQGYCVALSLSDFESAFLKLFENPEELPSAD